MRRHLGRLLPAFAFAVVALTTVATPVTAAPHEWHSCPDDARATIAHTGDASWVATNQSSRPVSSHVGPIGGVVALICVYTMFGTDYWIYKRPSPDLQNCRALPDSNGRPAFECMPL